MDVHSRPVDFDTIRCQPRLTKVSIMGDVGNIELQEWLISWIKRSADKTVSLDCLHATISKCDMDWRLKLVHWVMESMD